MSLQRPQRVQDRVENLREEHRLSVVIAELVAHDDQALEQGAVLHLGQEARAVEPGNLTAHEVERRQQGGGELGAQLDQEATRVTPQSPDFFGNVHIWT